MMCQNQIFLGGRASTYCVLERGHDGKCLPDRAIGQAYGLSAEHQIGKNSAIVEEPAPKKPCGNINEKGKYEVCGHPEGHFGRHTNERIAWD